jgi:hypothetical protein
VFRCLPRILYATILPFPREFYGYFTQTVIAKVKRLGLRVSSNELQRLTIGAEMLQAHTCTGNIRKDLVACGFIPPQPGVWKLFVAAAVVEGSDALTMFRKELILQKKKLMLSSLAYHAVYHALTPSRRDTLRMVDEQVCQVLIQPVRLRLKAADSDVTLIQVDSDSDHVLFFKTT